MEKLSCSSPHSRHGGTTKPLKKCKVHQDSTKSGPPVTSSGSLPLCFALLLCNDYVGSLLVLQPFLMEVISYSK